nr:hypothetical protein [Grimontia hollisae]
MNGVSANMAGRALSQNEITEDKALKTTEVGTTFEKMVQIADDAVEKFIKAKGDSTAGLQLSAGESLQLQRLMGDQSITVQTGTATLKGVKDSIISAARNI